MDGTLSAAIAEYIEQRKQEKLKPLQKKLNSTLEKSSDPVEIAQAKVEYSDNAMPIELEFEPKNWLSNKAKLAKQITIATHAPKYLNSDAKASGIYLDKFEILDNRYLVTQHIPKKSIDFIGNAAVLDVATFLKMEVKGESLIDQLNANHINALKIFTDDPDLLDLWKNGFKQAFYDENVSAHTLSKQVYFLINKEKKEYHLLCPLYSSALSQELYFKIRQSRYGDSKEIRDAYKKGLYDERSNVYFLETAVQMFGGSKPQNISQLNSERHGQGFLLNCAPPTYQAQIKPPLHSLSIFNRQFSFQTNALIREFKAFLAGLTEKDRNFKTRYQRDYHYVKPLIDSLLNFIAEIQSIPNCSGWSNSPECKMKRAHQLLLDIDNPDLVFQREREQGDWLESVANDFSLWLLRKLENKQVYVLGDVEHRYFKKLCLNELRTFERISVIFEENNA
ncbi:type I-F CRISPR-associated protein Csy1 [Proteus terrae subsp. cibarius]|uniref:Type I-F CRISPR-associated protein Csy1 n=1 Tax=Proteus terrae subsp. cibarius TaxID=626774 RepID=A0ABX6JIS9_9GAMM|nr:type I-F CRISPR-associated protein Csy1 [Proteus terrae]QGW03907.1 type I-F CRISPR-associated protein Csy1 [Proteus terrae subsp. cibarius]QIF89086.1 type I-F CRISPR-associated protein Csy1 [Proteus terrae subsp. cibarius]